MNMIRKRNFRIDVLRAFACIMVLFCHSPQPYYGQSGQFLLGINNYFSMAWGPILFFMISGACILWEEHEAIPFLKKRLSRVLVPTVFWSLVYIIIESFIWHTAQCDQWVARIPMIILGPQYSLMWFMYALIAIYLIAPIFSKWLNRSSEKEVCFYLIIWAGVLSLPYLEICGVDISQTQSRTGLFYYMSGFLWYAVAGYYCRKYMIIKKYRWWHWLLAASILFSPVYVFVIKNYTGILLDTSKCLFPALSTIFAFVFFMNIRVSNIFISSRFRTFVENISRLSFGIYLTHMIFMYPFRLWIAQHNLNYVIQIPLTVIVIGIISYLFSFFLAKLPFGKYLVG